MAAEVPVSDILCEAMEYLSKLGSNLRTRSENLKEKRISKEKLKNSHAVQKAASKVLLICELSKKSLDNVEAGVRKVMSLLEKSQAPVGGKKNDITTLESKHHYFEYQSRKLRIAKKIHLKHYMSVKVFARGMPVSMQENYPVYYDCKLKRHRRKIAAKIRSEIHKASGNGSKIPFDSDSELPVGTSVVLDCTEEKVLDVDQKSPRRNDKCTDSDKELSKIEKDSARDESADKTGNKDQDGSDSDSSANVEENIVRKSKELQRRHSKSDKKTPTKKKSGRIKIVDVYSSDSNEELEHNRDTDISPNAKNKEDCLSDNSNHESNAKKSKLTESDNSRCQSESDLGSKKRKIDKEFSNKHDSDNDVDQLPVGTSEVLDCTEEKVLDVEKKTPRRNDKCTDSDKGLSEIEKDTARDESADKIGNKDQDGSDSDSSGNVEENIVRMSKKHQRRHSKSDKKTPTKKKSGRIKIVDIYSSDSNEELEHNRDTDISPNAKNKEDCLSDNSNHESNAKKSKLTESDNSRCQSESDLGSKKRKIDKEFSNKHDSENDSTMSKQVTQNESGGESKPVIRCVNLSKLLKPDVLSKTNGQQSYHKKVRRKEENNDNEFWAQKRKEVRQFKPKNFSINIARLPTVSVAFLLSNNLKKITKCGNVICKVSNENDTPNSKKMKAVKNALLNDSESDECGETHDAIKVKKSLLKDSDSEHKISDEEHVKKPDNNKKRDKSSSGKENTEKRKKSKEAKSDTDNIQSDLDSATKNDRQEDNCHETPRLESIDEGQNQNTNEECNVQSNENDPVTSTKINETVKAALLNDLSDEDFAGFSKNVNSEVSTRNENNDNLCDKNQSNGIEPETPAKINQAVKSSLLNDSSDDDSAGLSKRNECSQTPSEINNSIEEGDNRSVDDQGIVTSNEIELETPTKLDEHTLLNTSSDDPFAGFSKKDVEESTKTNENIKTSLLKDSSDENSNKNEEESPTKVNQKVKSALLNDSSDVKSDSSVDQKQRQKTPKSKRKKDRKSREAKQKLRYSSSDSDQEKPKRRSRKKARSSSSSSSEDIKQKEHKTKKMKINSDSSDSNNKTIDQVDGAIDEKSSSSVKKMVRSKAKPSGSSSQNSDNQDASDKDIDGLTNLSNLNKNRRRETSTRSRQAGKSSNRSKDTPIIGEDLLKAESSSDASEADVNNDTEIVQDLPEVTLTGLNGDHMAKDDLLGDSDSSVSHHDKDGSENPENSEEDNVKSTRRKANAISSDSDGGSNRRKAKQDDDRMSDFEDSEAESSEPGKKAKRKKKVSDSDASVDSTDGKKKRKRIKVVNDSEEGSGSDTENEGRNKHGRKNIRKVMGKNQLEEATKKAARQEKERIARITERQKLYNNLDFDESGKPDEVVLEKVVLDFDPETKEPLIQVDRGLVKKLKPHQANGIKFMWDACFESVKRIKKDKGSGCILAHCMGLGKTLQVISLTHTLLIHGDLTGVNRVLVVCPLSTVLNWVNEIRMWLKHAVTDFEVDVYELSRYKQNSERAFQLQQWFDGGGVCVLGYEMFRNLSADNNKKFKKKMLKSFQESLVDPGPDLVVCDEGHLLKNEKTSLSQSMNRVRTLRRIVLTGTPLQNNLKEYYCMVQFVKPNLLGKYNEYLNRFVNPITNGQYTDSTEHDIRVMKRRSHVLHKMLDGAVQRRDYGVLAPFLPPKHEYVLFITLTEVQVKLYQYYLDNYSRRPLAGKSSGFLFPDFQSLQRIWTHPLVLKYNSERYEIMQQKKRDKEEEDSEGSLVDFIDDDSTPDESSTEESSDDSSDMSDDSRKKSKKNKKSSKKGKGKDSKGSTRRGTRANPTLVDVDDEDNGADDVIEVKNENPTEWWIKLVEESELEDMRNSHKLVLLFDILRQCETIGDKLLVFSQSLYSLDLIEHFLGKVDEATQEGRIDEKLGGHVGSWSPGVDYFRLDGSTSCENRSIWCKNFNREDNPRARLFLISTRAGGLGINLVAANRVVIFDVSWNPSHDVQSIFRVYRFGQKKPCYVYRFLAMGTMEEKIYERQVTKQAISKRVIDEQQIDRHYAENDLAELYKFEAAPQEPRPLPTLPKDRLFAEMLKEHEAQIYKYHEHDSLLENKEEETLSEEERKAAWEDFENEKSRPPPAPFASAWPMHNGMVPGLLAQQQQQLAYAALAAMIRKDMPNINDNQIRDMLPLIYNSNPQMFGGYDYGLMQKMGEIYKYAQPGMMNPGMMNPVMNSGGSGGASGLQYEPPWQRQHQQQQQMRLQQLMQQQQNQMGAKFYAGGLGSRDPIAMALQQQRAREMLMGGAASGAGGAGAGRPRGRPPLRPPTTSQDVVNLDSD